ncbi:amidohydrolase family protein [Cryptosporangium sp. NPDC048952]|uniref:amidohydrolase family protein n=1 Tax=Cryptosporangium sp. NPDC048952 TaxID=3363961 RepID=UPI00371DE007
MIDFHARLGAGLLDAMDAAGIARAAVSAGGLVTLDRLSELVAAPEASAPPAAARPRADNAAVLAAAGDRLVPFYFADPFTDVEAYAKAASDYRGLEISPAIHGFRYDDPNVRDLIATARAANHPVYTVCLARPGTRATDLAALASDVPDVHFVFGHCGFTGLDAAGLTTLAPLPNVAAELSGSFTAIARLAIARFGPGRVLFGTEYPLQDPRVELAKLAALDLDPATYRAVTDTNARRLLGES